MGGFFGRTIRGVPNQARSPKLLGPDIFLSGGGLVREGVVAKMFWRDIPEKFGWDIPVAPEKFEKKRFVFNFWPLPKMLAFAFALRLQILKRSILKRMSQGGGSETTLRF